MEHFIQRYGVLATLSAHTPTAFCPILTEFNRNFLIQIKKEKKMLQKKTRWVGFTGPRMLTLPQRTPTEIFLLFSEGERLTELLSLATLRESDSSRNSKLLKMTLILPFGDTTMENEKYPLI